jgi:hypothetical protein
MTSYMLSENAPQSASLTNLPADMEDFKDDDPDVHATGNNNVSNNQQFSDNEVTILMDVLEEYF